MLLCGQNAPLTWVDPVGFTGHPLIYFITTELHDYESKLESIRIFRDNFDPRGRMVLLKFFKQGKRPNFVSKISF